MLYHLLYQCMMTIMLMMMMMPTQMPMIDFVQSKAHEEAMAGLIKGGYIKTCTAGNLQDIAHDATWLFLCLHYLLLRMLFCVRP